MKKIKILVVDDSALIRNLMTRIINSQHDMEVMATAPDPCIAGDLLRAQQPDVMTLDIEMPRMNGLDFLEQIMRTQPLPVVMISSLTERGAETTLRALELGAVDFVAKPRLDLGHALVEYAEEITDKIRAAYLARNRLRLPGRQAAAAPAGFKARPKPDRRASSEKLILIGASTGGTEAIKEILLRMPPDCPGILITQHMPATFTKSFAQRLDNSCTIAVKEAEDGEPVLAGHAYIAPGGKHLLLKRQGNQYVTEISEAAPVNRHRPSVEVLFQSGARHAGKNAIGIILTGMGKDGAIGMLALRRAGAYNIAQNESSCVVFGMPREAIEIGAVHAVLPLQEIAEHLLSRLDKQGHAAQAV